MNNTSPGTARNTLGRAVSGNLPGLVVASHTNGRERPAADHASGDGGALCRAPISPYPIPLGDPEIVDLRRSETLSGWYSVTPSGSSCAATAWAAARQLDARRAMTAASGGHRKEGADEIYSS